MNVIIFNFQKLLCINRKRKLTPQIDNLDIDIHLIDKLDIPNQVKIQLIGDDLAKSFNVIYINKYCNGVLVNMYLSGSNIYVKQSFKNMYSLPIFSNKILVGQIGLCDIADNDIPEGLDKITDFLGKLLI